MKIVPMSLFLVCLLGETLLMAGVGAALLAFSPAPSVPFAVGIGFIAYAVAVLFYSCLSLWRAR